VQDEDGQTPEPPAETEPPKVVTDAAAGKEGPAASTQGGRLHRPAVHRLGALGCLTMALAAVVGIALLMTGNFFAGAAGIVIVAIAAGVGLWLSAVSSLEKRK
jgi:hypothetical protein